MKTWPAETGGLSACRTHLEAMAAPVKVLALVVIAAGAVVGAAGTSDYTGFWMGDCQDGFGVQIKRVDSRLYSVSFCGPGGCFGPGDWTPNTPIEGDPHYKVVSPTQLGIKRTDAAAYFMYVRCTSDPTWIVRPPPASEPAERLDCSPGALPEDDGVLIAWITDVRQTTQYGPGIEEQTTTVGSFRPVAVSKGPALREASGSGIRKDQPFWRVLSPGSRPIRLASAESFLDHMNVDHCVYHGSLERELPRWTLLSSQPLHGVFRRPTPTDHGRFRRLDTTCVQQGDPPEGQTPPCVRPELLALTDVDQDGKPEYWATRPYLWDTGLSVWEDTGVLVPILEVCVGCSD